MPRVTPRPESYFWDRVKKTEGCWLWTGHVDKDGYGRIDGGMRAMRYAYLLLVGPIPQQTPRLVIDHICRNPRCVRPGHLEAVTDRTNTLRGVSPAAIAAASDVCKRGHRLSGDNLRIAPNGWRKCRTCERERKQEKRRAA